MESCSFTLFLIVHDISRAWSVDRLGKCKRSSLGKLRKSLICCFQVCHHHPKAYLPWSYEQNIWWLYETWEYIISSLLVNLKEDSRMWQMYKYTHEHFWLTYLCTSPQVQLDRLYLLVGKIETLLHIFIWIECYTS